MKKLILNLAILLGASGSAWAEGTPAPAAEAPPAKVAPAAPAAKAAPAPAKKAALLDINSASAEELKTLPGMNEEIVQKLIAGRPYKGKDALLKQSIVDKEGYAKISKLIIAKQMKKVAAAPALAPEAPAPAPAPTK
jgi:DNA uptake protein ComE-like DNA-binding protein